MPVGPPDPIPSGASREELRAIVNDMNDKIDDIKDKVNDIMDKLNE
jgi:hypothetical protein